VTSSASLTTYLKQSLVFVKFPFNWVSLDSSKLEATYGLQYLPNMQRTIEELAEQAMSLSGESRARLADLLVESLDAGDLTHTDHLWLSEAKRRRDEVRNGKVETIPGEEALRSVRESLPR
jgi:hypothetical protein